MQNIAFIFGLARSGTNLVAGALNAHPDVRVALDPLLPFFKGVRAAIGDDLGVKGPARAAFDMRAPFQDGYFRPDSLAAVDAVMAGDIDHRIPGDGKALIEAIVARAALESPPLASALAGRKAGTFKSLLDGVLETVGNASGEERGLIGCKELWTADFIPMLARAYPQARFIVNRRDPRAIIASLVTMARKDPTQAAHTISYMRHWRKEAAVLHMLAKMPILRGRLAPVRYEAFVGEPDAAIEVLCTFLGLPPDPSMHFPKLGRDSAGNANSSYGPQTGISASSLDKWRDVLEPAMVRCIEYHCGAEMMAEGYALTTDTPWKADTAVREVVMAADEAACSWRSDAGDPAWDLDQEARRWDLLAGATPEPGEIRRNFLFEPVFENLTAKTSWRTT